MSSNIEKLIQTFKDDIGEKNLDLDLENLEEDYASIIDVNEKDLLMKNLYTLEVQN